MGILRWWVLVHSGGLTPASSLSPPPPLAALQPRGRSGGRRSGQGGGRCWLTPAGWARMPATPQTAVRSARRVVPSATGGATPNVFEGLRFCVCEPTGQEGEENKVRGGRCVRHGRLGMCTSTVAC